MDTKNITYNIWWLNKKGMTLCMGFLIAKSHSHYDWSSGSYRPSGPTIEFTTVLNFFVYEFWNGKVMILYTMAFQAFLKYIQSDPFEIVTALLEVPKE